MSEAATKALDLADKWAQQIGEKIQQAAPGAQEIVVEAAIVQMGSAIVSWLAAMIGLTIALSSIFYCLKKYTKASIGKRGDLDGENSPWFFGSLVSVMLALIMLIGVFGTFPSRELVGIFAPRGYIALMIFDKIK